MHLPVIAIHREVLDFVAVAFIHAQMEHETFVERVAPVEWSAEWRFT